MAAQAPADLVVRGAWMRHQNREFRIRLFGQASLAVACGAAFCVVGFVTQSGLSVWAFELFAVIFGLLPGLWTVGVLSSAVKITPTEVWVRNYGRTTVIALEQVRAFENRSNSIMPSRRWASWPARPCAGIALVTTRPRRIQLLAFERLPERDADAPIEQPGYFDATVDRLNALLTERSGG